MHNSLARFSFCFAFVIDVLWPTPGHADLASCNVPPGYYRIVNPAAKEAVQLRAEPSQSSMFMGVLGNDEVVFSDGTRNQGQGVTWQRIRQDQVEGWVEASHLWRALPITLAKTDLPVAGSCGATSPPWGLRWDEHSVRMSLFPEKHEFTVQSVQAGVSPGSVLVTGLAPNASLSFVYSDEICHGVGNSSVGWGSAYIVLSQNGVQRLYKGCCNALRTAFTNR